MRFEETDVWGFRHAFRGMRNPKNSWHLSDSYADRNPDAPIDFVIGEKDLTLAQTLIKGGSEHRKFMRQIFVSVDIVAPLYWWKEFDTYKVGTTSNSCSTMHKLSSTPITLECFETDDFDDEYVDGAEIINFLSMLEKLRQKFNETKKKKYWKELIRWLPDSWLQKRTITMNYENIFTMIRQRQNHKLNEWSGRDEAAFQNFIAWAHTLPYANELLFYGLENQNEAA